MIVLNGGLRAQKTMRSNLELRICRHAPEYLSPLLAGLHSAVVKPHPSTPALHPGV
ncbi:hypothetical protein ANO14919_048740 [Xylariales sp. No.14919]|nr:hypothetical protein ANO14919_048740 [Xylariales sp. No.14919]